MDILSTMIRVIFITAVVSGCTGFIIGDILTDRIWKQKAVDRNVAEWVIKNSKGETEFRWKNKQELEDGG